MRWWKPLLASLTFITPLFATAAAQSGPPLEYFAIREVIQGVQVSPDGDKLALLRNDSRDGNPILEIYNANDLTETPLRIKSDPMELVAVAGWINDNIIAFVARQKIRNRIEGFNDGIYATKVATYNIEDESFSEFDNSTTLANILINEPNKIILAIPEANTTRGDDDPFAAFRPRSYYEVNLDTGSKSLIIKGSSRYGGVAFDDDGNPRATQGYDPTKKEFVFYYRNVGENSWREIYRRSGFSFENFSYVGDVEGKPGIVQVLANNGNDLIGLWEFNTSTREFGELIFRDGDADIASVRTHSNDWGVGSQIVGANYYGEKLLTEWFDPDEQALYEQLQGVIPNAHQISVTSMSRDGNTYTVFNSGPKDTGSTYLVKDGRLQKIGSLNPLLTPDMLSPVEYIKYPARDGRTIPAYVITPTTGEPPYPLVVLPHGGPHVAEIIGYDEWGQLLASRGYMVLYPQYRGSLGYGIDHFIATWNEHGLKMQDDKDDGALYLVGEGLADPDRLAMFGWSYGGYAALVAVSRDPQIYKCAIAGAPVSDPTMQFNYYKRFLRDFEKEFEDQRRSGIAPVDEVDKINIPLLFIHPRDDQRVPYDHKRVYERALRSADTKDLVRFVTLEGADHFSNTLYYRHQIELYTEMTKFLAEECGPGGL